MYLLPAVCLQCVCVCPPPPARAAQARMSADWEAAEAARADGALAVALSVPAAAASDDADFSAAASMAVASLARMGTRAAGWGGGTGEDVLSFLAAAGQEAGIRALLAPRPASARADPSASLDWFGTSALMAASLHGHTAVARLLLEAGADPTYVYPRTHVRGDCPSATTAPRSEKKCMVLS